MAVFVWQLRPARKLLLVEFKPLFVRLLTSGRKLLLVPFPGVTVVVLFTTVFLVYVVLEYVIVTSL